MISELIQFASNRLVPYHKSYARFAQHHTGKKVAIIIDQPKVALYTIIHQSGFCIIETDEYDAAIELNIPALIKFIGFQHPHASLRIKGDQALGMAASNQLSLNKIHIKKILNDTTSPSISVLLEEIFLHIRSISGHASVELKKQFQDCLINDLGICLDKDSYDQLYEKTMRLKWMLQELQNRPLKEE